MLPNLISWQHCKKKYFFFRENTYIIRWFVIICYSQLSKFTQFQITGKVLFSVYIWWRSVVFGSRIMYATWQAWKKVVRSTFSKRKQLCSRNYQNVKLRLHGVGILQSYYHNMLREIKFWYLETVKNVIFGNFRGSEFWIWFCAVFQCWKWQKIKF